MEQSQRNLMSWKQKTKPAIYGRPMKARNVKLDEKTIARAQQLAGGNLSAGLRLAVAMAEESVCKQRPTNIDKE